MTPEFDEEVVFEVMGEETRRARDGERVGTDGLARRVHGLAGAQSPSDRCSARRPGSASASAGPARDRQPRRPFAAFGSPSGVGWGSGVRGVGLGRGSTMRSPWLPEGTSPPPFPGWSLGSAKVPLGG